jgi:hypothetical protein
MSDPDVEAQFLRLEASVLLHVLDEHPTKISLSNLVNFFATEPTSETEAEEIEQIARQLAGDGLVYLLPIEASEDSQRVPLPLGDKLVVPTKAALQFEKLARQLA